METDNNTDATDGAVFCVCVCQSARVKGVGECTIELSTLIIVAMPRTQPPKPSGKNEVVHRQ